MVKVCKNDAVTLYRDPALISLLVRRWGELIVWVLEEGVLASSEAAVVMSCSTADFLVTFSYTFCRWIVRLTAYRRHRSSCGVPETQSLPLLPGTTYRVLLLLGVS